MANDDRPVNVGAPDPEFDAAAIEAGRRLFAQECKFIFGAASLDALPPPERTEIAFAGRSNVGKSSLVNALTGRRTLARVSQTPGRTRQINFFMLSEALVLVDLPGYGYAKASKTMIRDWTRLVEDYLRGRPSLRRLCLLIDARHGIKPPDRDLMDMLDASAVSYQAVLTKADKASSVNQVVDQVAAELTRHPAAHPEIRVTSARTGAGIETLRAAIAALAEPEPLR